MATLDLGLVKGDPGAGLVIKDLYPTLAELKTAHPTGTAGDAYAVGTASSNVVYVWSDGQSDWVSIGPVQVPLDESITPAKLSSGTNALIAKGGRLKVTVPISASSTAANIGTLSNSAITAAMVVLESTVANPSYQTSDWTVTTAAGSLTINGTASAATSVTIILGEV